MAVDTSTATNDWGFIDGSSQSTEDASGNVEVQAGAPLEGTNLVAAEADAVTGEGVATASVEGTAALFESRLVAGGDADVNAREVLDVIAASETTTGQSEASATLGETGTAGREGLNGGVIRSDQTTGGDYNLQSTVDNQTIASANSTSEGGEFASADATATLLNSYGVLQTNIDVEGDAAVTVDVSDNTAASASTTSDGAEAEVDRGEVTGIRFGNFDKLDVEGNGVVDVKVGTFLDPNTASAVASNTGDGDASATLLTADNYGITGKTEGNASQEVLASEDGAVNGTTSNSAVAALLTQSIDEQSTVHVEDLSNTGSAAPGDVRYQLYFSDDVSNTEVTSSGSVVVNGGGTATPVGSEVDPNTGGDITADGSGFDISIPEQAAEYNVIVVTGTSDNNETRLAVTSVVENTSGDEVLGATIEIAGNGDVAAEVANSYNASATSTTGDATATANTSGGEDAHIASAETIGIDAALVDIDGDGVIEGSVENFTDVDAETVTGDADALSVSGLQAGIEAATLDVAGNAIIEGGVLNLQEASAKTTSEDPSNNNGADADTKSGVTTGIDAETVNLGGNAFMEGIAEVGQLAEADAVTGDAYANVAFEGDVKGIDNSETTTAAGGLEVLAVGEALGLATASNVNPSEDSSDTASATAELNADVYGLDQTTSGAFDVAGNYDVTAIGDAQLGAIASSTNDDAEALATNEHQNVFGASINVNHGDVNVHGTADIEADANVDFESEASTTTGDAEADSVVNNVEGLDIDDINVGEALNVDADANVTAASTTNNVNGAADSNTNLEGDLRGFDLDEAVVKGDSNISGGVTLNASSSATTTTGDSTALVDQDFKDDVDGIRVTDNLQVGGSSAITASVDSTLEASATSTTGAADADVNQRDSRVTALNAGDDGVQWGDDNISVGGDLDADASIDQKASATSLNVDGGTSSAKVVLERHEAADLDVVHVDGAAAINGNTDIEATANAESTSDSADADVIFSDTTFGGASTKGIDVAETVTTGDDLGLDGQVVINATAIATNVGDSEQHPSATAVTANVDLQDDTQGIDLNEATVGGNALIDGGIEFNASAQAESTNSTATSKVENDQHDTNEAFSLNHKLTVNGSADVTGEIDSNLNSEAVSVAGAADADVDLNNGAWRGIDANHETITVNGDLAMDGSVEQSANADATSTASTAEANIRLEDYEGTDVDDVNVKGSSDISGEVDLNLTASAESTADNANAVIDAGDGPQSETDWVRTGPWWRPWQGHWETTWSEDSDSIIGVDANNLNIDGALELDGSATIAAAADATSVSGTADATFALKNDTQGIDLHEGAIGSDADIDALVNITGSANAMSTGAAANALVTSENVLADAHEGNDHIDEVIEAFSLGNSLETGGSADISATVNSNLNAEATSTAGTADANVYSSDDIRAVDVDEHGSITTGADLAVDGTINMAAKSAAVSVGDTATAKTDLDEKIIAVETETLSVGKDLDLDANVDLDSAADAQSVSGNADADVKIDDEEISAWQSNGEVTIEGGATINAAVDSLLEASSDTTSGVATSDIDLSKTSVNGVDAVEDVVDVNGNLEMEASVSIDGTASASNTDSGSATANIQGDNFLGAITEDLDVAGDATRTATVDLNFNSDANSTANDATATVEFDLAIASLDGGLGAKTAPGAFIGGDASIDAAATVNADASASTVGGDALAQNGEFTPFDNKGSYVGGYTIAGGKGQNVVPGLDVDGNASITASGTSNRSANAASTQGDADAEVALRAVTGLAAKSNKRQNGDINVDGNADLSATANADGIANANSTGTIGNDNAAFATVDQDQVIGLTTTVGGANNSTGGFPVPAGTDTNLSFGGNVEFAATANSTQQANAAITNGDAQAWSGLFDETYGVLGGDIDISGNATGFMAMAGLNAESNADSVTGENQENAAYADAGSDSSTAGMVGTGIQIDGNVSNANGLVSMASTTLVSNAEATTGSALAKSATFDGMGGISGDGVQTIGAQDVDLDVSGNVAGEWGVRGIATSDIAANAATVTGADAEADILATTIGWNGGDIDISGNGNITAIGSQVANAAADIVTSTSSTTATSNVEIDAAGAELDTNDITIGGNGSIAADGFITGSSLATGVTSASVAGANLVADGLALNENSATIDGSGSISARGLIGSWGINNLTGDYQATTAFEVAASSVTGNSDATSESTANGLSDGSVTAGPSGGDILGIASAAVNTSSHTTNGHSTATNDGTMNGINMVDITGGQAGSNLVDGRAIGVFNTTATNTTGDATASSHTQAKGMAGDMSSASNNGTFYGLAELSNTVVASTVTGAASATATGSAIGIDQYSLTMEGDGVISANATVNSVARSSTISGSSM